MAIFDEQLFSAWNGLLPSRGISPLFNNPWFDYNTIFKTSHIIDFTTLGKVLYNVDEGSGSYNSVVLSESCANYDYLRIFYTPNDGYLNSILVYKPNGKKVLLMSGYSGTSASDAGGCNIKLKTININGKNITVQSYKEFQSGGVLNYNYIKIYRVEGWNLPIV